MLRLPLALSLVLASSLVGCGPKDGTEAPASEAPAVSGTPAPAPTPEPTPTPAATPDCQTAPFATWPACASQTVTVRGTNPQAIMQHPIFAGPDETQGYLDVPNVGQIIVLTRAPFECPAAVVATGTLRRIEPTSGEPGVKSMDSYGGWVLEGATVECGGTP